MSTDRPSGRTHCSQERELVPPLLDPPGADGCSDTGPRLILGHLVVLAESLDQEHLQECLAAP